MESHRPDFELDPAFLARVPASLRHLYVSNGYIQRQRRHRGLAQPADDAPVVHTPWPFPRL
jgi:hypothetical protein